MLVFLTCLAYHVHARNSQNHMLGAPCAHAKFAEPHALDGMCPCKFTQPHARRNMCTCDARRTTCSVGRVPRKFANPHPRRNYNVYARNSQNHMLCRACAPAHIIIN